MAGISTGIALLPTSSRNFVLNAGIGGNYYSTGGTVTASESYTISESGYGGVNSVTVEFTGTGSPSYSLANPSNSLSNTITFTKTGGSYSLFNGAYRVKVITNDGTIFYSSYFNLKMVVHYFYLTTSYTTSSYTVAGVARSYTVDSPDSWGQSYPVYTGYSSTSSNPDIEISPDLPSTNLYIYITPDKFGVNSSNITFAAKDSEGITGGYGGTIPVSLNRAAAWITASTTSSATFGAGNGYYLECEVENLGSIDWGTGSNSPSSSTGMVDGFWATEAAGICKTVNDSSLQYKTKYTHVSGDTRWVVTDGISNYSKDTLLDFGRKVRLTNNTTIGTVTSTIKIGFYTTSDTLLYEQTITLSVVRTAL